MKTTSLASYSPLRAPCSLLFGLAILALCVCVAASNSPAAPPLERGPNIVLIVADDLGYGDLGCYGQQHIKTPHLDELARQGLRFTQFYCGAPVCAPSRCALMTGKHTGHAAIRNNKPPKGLAKIREQYAWETPGQQPLPNSEVTIAELLHTRGYATAAVGKWGLGMPGTSGDVNRQGFDLFYGYHCQAHAHNHYPKFLWRNDKKEPLTGNDGTATGQTHSQDRFTDEALQFLKQHRERPFFLYLPFTIPHLSLQVPAESLAQYADKLPEASYNHKDAYFPHDTPHAAYAAMVSHMDSAVGKIVAEIERLGLSENTLILFTSDNGPVYNRLGGSDSEFFNSSGPLRGRKGSVYEGGIRVPLIARWPGRIAAGRETTQIAANWDILPTLCEIAKSDIPQKLDGISLTSTLFGKDDQRQHEYLYWEFPAYSVQQAIRAGNWKVVRRDINQGDEPFELYDLSTDIAEQHDVATDHPEIIRRLTAHAAAAHAPSNVFPLFASEKPAPKNEKRPPTNESQPKK
jgi:arylsulfatase